MPVIALLTDFGTSDGHVAAMKAVIQSICPKPTIIDISHGIAPQRIAEARFILWSVYRYFPPKTIFVCVVDPGVGTKRKIIAVKTQKHMFLAPDNGLLDLVLTGSEVKKAIVIKDQKYFLKDISNTFHGRDIFSPAAAHLAKGIKITSLGPSISLKKPKDIFIPVSNKGDYNGTVIYSDRFGNLITNFQTKKIRQAELKIKEKVVYLHNTYGDVNEGELLALTGSSGLIEIAVRNGSAKEKLHADYGTPLQLSI
jgi:S-adenosyl-L-methionine hydrolase (adenosine-forming)